MGPTAGNPSADGRGRTRTLALLSVVAPVYDERETIEAFHERLRRVAAGLPHEIILVDDGSRDGTGDVLERIAERDPNVQVITFSRNFGHQAALTAGLDHARGDAVVTLDSDLQDPPEVIPELLDRWRDGVDVVYAVRSSREGETRSKLLTARWFYRLFSKLAGFPLENSGDFRLLDRRALDVLRALPERNRFLRGLSVWIGFTQTAVPYERAARPAGETKFTVRRMVRFSLDALSSFSFAPLQAATLLGFALALVAFLGIPVTIGMRIAGEFVPGIATVLLVVLGLGGIQLITVGIIGEYVGRIYDEVKARPLYIVAGHVNAPEEGPPSVHGQRPGHSGVSAEHLR